MEFSIPLIIAKNSRKSRATLLNFVVFVDRATERRAQRIKGQFLDGSRPPVLTQRGCLTRTRYREPAAPLIDPIVWARGWFFLVFVDVDLEALAVTLVLPVSDGVTDVVEERTAAEVEIANKHAAEMADVTCVVSAGA